jgi:hypothetical protein
MLALLVVSSCTSDPFRFSYIRLLLCHYCVQVGIVFGRMTVRKIERRGPGLRV